MIDYAFQILAAVIATLAAVEVARMLPLTRALAQARAVSSRAVSVVRANRISDHWKERVLPVYAGRLLGASLKLLACIVAIAVAFLLPFWLIWSGLVDGVHWTTGLTRADILIVSLCLAIAAVWLRPMGRASV